MEGSNGRSGALEKYPIFGMQGVLTSGFGCCNFAEGNEVIYYLTIYNLRFIYYLMI